MRADVTLQMEPTFREKVIAGRDRYVKQNKNLRFLIMPVSGAILAAHRFFMYFYSRAKKFSAVFMVAAAFAASSSFAFPVLSMHAGFVSLDAGSARAAESIPGAEYTEDVDAAAAEGASVDVDAVAQESSVVFADDAVMDAIEDTSLLNEEYESESGSDLGETVTLSELLDAQDFADATADVDEASADGFDPEDWRLILVNKQHPIPDDYEVELGNINDSMRCDKRIVGNLLEMFQAAADDGVTLIVCSPYRTHEHQVELFNRKIDKYMGRGLSYMESYSRAGQAVTVPGTSEHEIGMAIDIVTSGYSSLNEGFGNTRAGKWLAANSADYGFNLRYPKGKEYITGIEYEPWHFRYVGREAAVIMRDEELCLEEFWEEYLYRK